MARNPKFNALLDRMREIHEKKNQDYAQEGNPYSNFDFAGELGSHFTAPRDIAFAVLIGVKLARLFELKGNGKMPQNESVADTHLDLAVYASLWASAEEKPAVTKEVAERPVYGARAASGHLSECPF